jgi:hypothetical protein
MGNSGLHHLTHLRHWRIKKDEPKKNSGGKNPATQSSTLFPLEAQVGLKNNSKDAPYCLGT